MATILPGTGRIYPEGTYLLQKAIAGWTGAVVAYPADDIDVKCLLRNFDARSFGEKTRVCMNGVAYRFHSTEGSVSFEMMVPGGRSIIINRLDQLKFAFKSDSTDSTGVTFEGVVEEVNLVATGPGEAHTYRITMTTNADRAAA